MICSINMFVLSLMYPHQHTEKSIKLVWKSPLEALEFKGWTGIGNYKVLSAALFIVMVVLYVIFANEETLRFFGLLK